MFHEVSAEMIGQTVEAVFMNMMDLQVEACHAASISEAPRLTACVHMAGAWNGALFVACSHRQACQFAGRFLGMEPPAAVNDEVRDVLGELANMIGGNVKFAMAKGLSLSMPSVSDQSDFMPQAMAGAEHERLTFQCAYGPFSVTLLEQCA